jgi:tRNA 2-selenouridine synthase
MPIQKVEIAQFLELSKSYIVLDVRSPGEYDKAHIPGAVSFPIFSNEERIEIGTAYKQKSKEVAVKIGLDYFGKNMMGMVEKVETIFRKKSQYKYEKPNEETVVLIHCWRGGMRSGAMAWLMDLYGFKVYLLIGGYKVYRHWVLEQFEIKHDLLLIGGYTGSGKTDILDVLKNNNHNTIDLEGLASHKGSALGALGLPPQPSQEMFENQLAMNLFEISQREKVTKIFIEDESQRVGNLQIPLALWKTMRSSKVYFLDIAFEERLNYITPIYSVHPKKKLEDAICRIEKRLGGLETKMALQYLSENNFLECFRILLFYYDKGYKKSLANRENADELIHLIPLGRVNANDSMQKLLSIS